MEEFIQLVSNVGFPIAVAVGMGWYVKYISDRYHDEIMSISEKHQEEISEMVRAVNNNTNAILVLTERIKKEEDESDVKRD